MTLFGILFTLQIMGIFICLVGIYFLFNAMSRAEAKFLLTAGISALIYGVGYAYEMLATSMDEAIMAVNIGYCGLAYIALLFAIYTTYATRVFNVPGFVWRLIFIYETINAALAITTKYTGFYYIPLKFVEAEPFAYLERENSILFYIKMLALAMLGMFSLLQLFIATRRATLRSVRRRFAFACVGVLIPIVAMFISIGGVYTNYEPISVVILWVFGIYAIIVTKGRVTNPVELAMANSYRYSTAGLVVTDEKGHYLNCNDTMYKIFPDIAEYELGVDFTFDIPEKGMIFDAEKHMLTIGERYYDVKMQEFGNPDKTVGRLYVVDDITVLERQMHEMAELKEKAEYANVAKSYFLANMSHEMRTPLNAIIGLSELSLLEDNKDNIDDYMNQIHSSGQMLLDIICDVLDFSKAESGKLELVSTEYDIVTLLDSVINMTNVRIGEKNIDFLVDINPALPRYLLGDAVRIRQVMINLLNNATKYTESGFIKLKVDFERSYTGIKLTVSVKDSGKGIRREDIEKLFKVFSQVDLKSNRNIQGTGLGLAISRQLIELMNGEIGVESTYGEGSDFHFSISQKVTGRSVLGAGKAHEIKVPKLVPFSILNELTPAEYTKDEESDEQIKKERKLYPNARVLVVDDNSVNLTVMQALLKSFGIAAEAVNNGEEAIKKTQETQYDLIFMDHMMPEMDGVEVTEHIRALEVPWASEVKIVACTANAIKGISEMLLECGMDDYICKPVEMNELGNILERVLG